ncbi:hypothetical protein B0T10DRAFT_577264 [Thelonectria olida]|uniref:Uncharacterized protein n=1 Tax=Thelonectria olida TaxID=1576542 RepID=A0A9P8VY29_9HYPO|nr:hypothetical protein B0T10DRAFT_577264 [Thelonectria olida]
MGGHYVTGYVTYIIHQERERALQGLDLGLDIKSIIVVDSHIDNSRHAIGLYDFFCSDWRGDGRQAPLMNATKHPGPDAHAGRTSWKRQPQFRNTEYQNWFYSRGELSSAEDSSGHLGGTWKGDGKLSLFTVLFTVDEAGHFLP